MGTVWRELRGSAGFLDTGCVSGEPVHQRATGTLGQHGRTILKCSTCAGHLFSVEI